MGGSALRGHSPSARGSVSPLGAHEVPLRCHPQVPAWVLQLLPKGRTPHSTHTQHATHPSYSLLSHLCPWCSPTSWSLLPTHPPCSHFPLPLSRALRAAQQFGMRSRLLPAPGLPAVADSRRALSSFHFLCNAPCEQLCCRCSRRRERGSRAPTGGAGAEAVPAGRSSGTHPGNGALQPGQPSATRGGQKRDKRKQNPTRRHPK